MSPDLWDEISDCLDRLMELEADEAEAYLRELRANRPTVCAEVESLWRQDTVTGRFGSPSDALLADISTLIGGDTVASTERPGGTAGDLELGREIARGGMGAVYEAHDPAIGRTLAVKVLLPEFRHHPEARARFLREARITGRLQHPGIPPIHSLGQFPDGTPFFAMKLIRGRTLAAILAESAPDRAEAVAIFEQICNTLAYAHSVATIHRDLKPSNVMVGTFGEVQVMDWGLAKVLGETEPTGGNGETAATDATVTRSGDIRGTPAFMAPEQARGDAEELDERCDVFGLGGILVALLTREATFTGSAAEMLRQARTGEVEPAIRRVEAAQADAELLAIVRRCLAPLKENRCRDAGEVATAVTSYRESARRKLEEAELARRTALAQAREERRRRRITLALGAALLVVVSAGLGVAIWLALLAEDRREAAVAAERQVSAERDRTEETARQARKAVKDGFILATEDPEFQKAGMQNARKLMLDRALAFYREFSELRKDDAALQEEVADAHERIGYILAERGEHQNALAAYDRAAALLGELAARQPDEPRFRLALAEVSRGKAEEELTLGNKDASAASLRTARDWLSPVLRGDPQNAELMFLDAQLQNSLGAHLYVTGRLDEALKYHQESLEKTTFVYETLKFRKVKVVTCAAANLVGIGHVLKDQRKPAEALAYYLRAVRPREDLHKAYTSQHTVAELARLHGSIAIVQGQLGQHEAEAGSLRTAIRYREQLASANPLVPDYRFDLITSYVNLVGTHGSTDAEGKQVLEKAVNMAEGLVREFPDKVAYLRAAAFARIKMAHHIRQDPKRIEKALEQLTEARKHLDEIERRKAMTPLFRQTLAEWETESGQVERMRERYAEAVKHFAAAEGAFRKLIDEGFQVENCRYAVARQQMSYAYAAGKTGDYDRALRAQQAGVEQLADLLKLRKDDRAILTSLERARTNMVELGKEALQRDLPAPKKDTIDNFVKHHRERLSRWRAWQKEYPTIEAFRQEAVEDAVAVASYFGYKLDPERKFPDAELAAAMDEIRAALAIAKENGLKDSKLLEEKRGLAHFRKLPEYQQFLTTLK